MKTTTKIIAGTIAAFSFIAASAVFAHPGMGQGMGNGAGMGVGMGPGMGMGMHGRMQGAETAAVVATRLDAVKAELNITAAQDGAWRAFAAAVQQHAAARESMRAQMQAQMQAQGPNATPAERSAHFEAMAQFREEHMAARSAALKDLYAVLTPEQKLIADQRLNMMPGHRMAWRAPAK